MVWRLRPIAQMDAAFFKLRPYALDPHRNRLRAANGRHILIPAAVAKLAILAVLQV